MRRGLENRAVLSAAALSDDGKHILISLLPAGRDDARAWSWSDSERTYHPRDGTVNFKDTIRSAIWSGDGNYWLRLLHLMGARTLRSDGNGSQMASSLGEGEVV